MVPFCSGSHYGFPAVYPQVPSWSNLSGHNSFSYISMCPCVLVVYIVVPLEMLLVNLEVRLQVMLQVRYFTF